MDPSGKSIDSISHDHEDDTIASSSSSNSATRAPEHDRFQFVFSTSQPGARSHAMRAFWRRRHSEQETQIRRNASGQSSLRRILPSSRPSSSHGEADGDSVSRFSQFSQMTFPLDQSESQILDRTTPAVLGIPAQLHSDIDHAFAFVRKDQFDQFPIQLTSQHKRLLYHCMKQQF